MATKEEKAKQAEADEKERLAQEAASKKRAADQAAADAETEELAKGVAQGAMTANDAVKVIASKYRFIDPTALSAKINERSVVLKEQAAALKQKRERDHAEASSTAQADSKGKIRVNVPKPFRLHLISGKEIRIPAGVQKVTKEVFEHFYSKANGMVEYKDED